MDQELLQPSQYRISTLSIDTRFADQVYDGSTADFSIRLPSTIRNVMRVALTSVEIPLVERVFSARNGNNTFVIDVGGVQTSLTLPAGTYTPDALAAALQTLLVPIVPLATVAYDGSTDRITVAAGAGPSFALLWESSVGSIAARQKYWGFGYYLGYRQKVVVVPSGPVGVVAPAPPQVAAPSYYLLQLQCPDMMENTMHRTAAGSSVPALAKLVLRGGAFTVQYDDGGNLLRKENTFAQPTALSQLRVRLLNAYGELVDMGDVDWSMTFEVVEVVSSCLYGDLNRAYGRC